MLILVRAKLIWMTFGIICVVLSCAILAYVFGGRQPDTVSLDVSISVIKLLFPFLLVFMSQELFFKEFERLYFLVSLSYPNSRSYFLFSRFLFLILLLVLALILTATLLWILLNFLSTFYQQTTPIAFNWLYWLNFIFIGLDFLVLASIALFLSTIASTSIFVLFGTLGFMFISRSFTTVVKLLNESVNNDLIINNEAHGSALHILSYFIMDLGALDIRAIALYNKLEFLPKDWFVLVIMCLLYSFIFVGLANCFFNKKAIR